MRYREKVTAAGDETVRQKGSKKLIQSEIDHTIRTRCVMAGGDAISDSTHTAPQTSGRGL